MKAIVVTISICLLMLGGCGMQEAETMVLLDEKIAEVNIAKSNGLGGMNEEILLSFTDQESIDILEQAITTAIKQPGKADVTAPEYDIMVQYKPEKAGELPTHGIHLWLGKDNEKSMFMYIADDAVYVTTPQMTKKLRKLLLSNEGNL